MQNDIPRKKANLVLLKLNTLKTPEVAHHLDANFVRKITDQKSAGNYRQNVTIATRLVTLPSFVRKNLPFKPSLNNLLHAPKIYPPISYP